MATLDINCDMGESFGRWKMGDDEGVVGSITTANIACGFHAGDPMTMLRTAELIAAAGACAGAHPGFDDLLGFGRRAIAMSPEDLYASFVYQIGAARAVFAARGLALHHVKPHGAVFGLTTTSREHARAVIAAIKDSCEQPLLYAPTSIENDPLPAAAWSEGVDVVAEFYPDLHYTDDGFPRFVAERGHVGAALAAERVRQLLDDGTVETVSGARLAVTADSICVHGDAPGAAAVAAAIRATIEGAGATVTAARPTVATR